VRFKRSPIDEQVKGALGIGPRERVLAWGVGDAAQPEDSYVVATDAGLYGQRGDLRIPWERVIKGTWEQPDFVLTIEGPNGAQRTRIRLAEPRDLPAAVRDRVMDTVVASEYTELGEGYGAQLVARRAPGGGVEDISWSIVFDAGLDPTDPRLRQEADRALADIRASLGI